MNEEERRILDRTFKMVEENNRILRAMHRSAIVGRIMHLLYWVLIIVASFAAYYLIQPYVGALNSAVDTVDQYKSLTQ